MSLTGVAALIAAVSFAVLACAGVYLAVRFTRVLGDAATLVRETRADQQALFARANTAVDRASAQLDRTEAATAGVADLGDSMTELAGQASRAGRHRPDGRRRGRRRPARPGRRRRLRRPARGGGAHRDPAAAGAGRPGRHRRGAAAAAAPKPAAGPQPRGRAERGDDPPRILAAGRGDRAASWATGVSPRSAASFRDAGAAAPGPAGRGAERQARCGLVRGTIRFTRDARRFGRDVREGMDLYIGSACGPGKPYA